MTFVSIRFRGNVLSCVQGDEITVEAQSGKPAPGIAGEAGLEQFNATMIETSDGWKVAAETVIEGMCSTS
jgi:hypothetical protein